MESDPGVSGKDVMTEGLLAELGRIPSLRREQRARELALFRAARGHGITWQDIADHCGLRSRQAALERYRALERSAG